MKSKTLNHPKLLDLADVLRDHLIEHGCSLSLPMAKSVAIGLLEQLRQFTIDYAPAGDIGQHRDAAIARAVGWEHDAGWLIEQLVELGLLDRHDEHRLVVHDWSRCADATCHRFVADEGIAFADGGKTHRKPRRNSPAGLRLREEQERLDREFEQQAYQPPPPQVDPPPTLATVTEGLSADGAPYDPLAVLDEIDNPLQPLFDKLGEPTVAQTKQLLKVIDQRKKELAKA